VQHLPILCREKGIPCIVADSKQKLGAAAGILVATASIAVIDAGETAGKIAEFAKSQKEEKQKADTAEIAEIPAEKAEATEEKPEAEEKPKRTRKKKEE